MVIKCLSVKNPWAFAILNLGKDIENRSLPTYYRGRVYIHSSKIPDSNGLSRVLQIGNSIGAIYNDMTVEEMMSNNGFILGSADLYDCQRDFSFSARGSSPWGEPGCWHWLLRDSVRLVKPVPAKGRLGFWNWEVPERWVEIMQMPLGVF
jgi:hypothetical protein